jgi:sugar O-acyltransferase (sialic acid O-acetyltransferase NeuD family)
MRVLIVGAGHHATVVCDALLAAGTVEVVGFVGAPFGGGPTLLGLPVLGPSFQELADLPGVHVVIAVGSNTARQQEFERATARGYPLINAIHPAAVITPRCTIGTGVMAMAGAIVNVGAEIGDNVILNTGCSVDHHCRVGPHSHLAPGVRLAGTAIIGELTLVGAGAVVLPGVTVGDRCIIGAGAVVTRDIRSGCTAVGVPARIIQQAP